MCYINAPQARRKLKTYSVPHLFLGTLLMTSLPVIAHGREPDFIQALPGIPHRLTSVAVRQNGQESRTLEPRKPIERELAGDQAHSYHLVLKAGQYLHAVVEQRGIDVVVAVFAPDGKKVAEVDSPNGSAGTEPVSLVAEATGTYRLEVRSLEATAAAGRYEVKVEELRAATEQDRNRIAAHQAYAEADRLEHEGSAQSLRKAIAKYEAALALWRTEHDGYKEAATLASIGNVHRVLSEPRQALEFYNQALLLYRAVSNSDGEANVLTSIGIVYYDLGERQKALDYLVQALPLWRAMSNRDSEAATLTNIGAVYDAIGERQKALDFYNQALPLQQAVGNRDGEAATLNNISRIYRILGEDQKALNLYNRALLLWRAVGNRSGEATALSNMGVVYNDLGEKRKALDFYNQALPLRRAVGDRNGEASTLNNIGGIYDDLGEKQKALDFYNQSLLLWRAVGNPNGEATILTNIATIYHKSGERQKALDTYNQALLLWRAVGDRSGEATALGNIGGIYDELGESQKALALYQQALSLRRAVSDRGAEADSLYHIAHFERERDKFNEARARIEEALGIVETLRTKIGSHELRSSYFATVQSYYDLYIDVLMQLHKRHPSEGHDGEALQASERARARSLLDTLAEAGVNIRQGVEPSLVERERALQKQLNAKAQEQMRLLGGQHTGEQATSIAKEIESLSIEYQQVEAQIRDTSPSYAALTQPQPLSLKEIQKLLDPETLLLEYALGERQSYLWAVTSASTYSFELPKGAEINAAAERMYKLLTARNRQPGGETSEARRTRLEQADAEYPEAAAALSRMILGPVSAHLRNKRLVIISDGALLSIPFAALPTPAATPTTRKGANPPLFVNHEIVNLPSISTLALLRREFSRRKPAARMAAVLADPVFDKHDERVKAAGPVRRPDVQPETATGTSLTHDVERAMGDLDSDFRFPPERLRATKWEAEAIAELVPAGELLQARDFAANRQTATDAQLSNYRIVHFATHAFINSVHPDLSGIVLSLVNERGDAQDGFLRVHEIFNLKLPAELVVLSACRTGLGKQVKGEGMVSMTRAFMYAGTPRVVVSLWSVNDRATSALMARFYKKMLGAEKLSPAAALRAAQIEIWRETGWKVPYYWAGFILQGEWKGKITN